jgi:hypothetical protein
VDAVTDQPTMEKRKPRAGAIRNREPVGGGQVSVSQGGPGRSSEAVATSAACWDRDAVWHFPTREALYEAVYWRQVEQLSRGF